MRTHLDIDPPGPLVAVPLPEVLRVRFEEGRAFEAQVMAELVAAVGPIPAFAGDPEGAAAAMADGVPLIAQAELVDLDGRRTGRPDLLVCRSEPTADGRPAYLPVDIKAHLVATASRTGTPLRAVPHAAIAALDPTAVPEVEGSWLRRRPDGQLQLAHYHRLLAHLGHAGTPLAGVIGSDLLLAVCVAAWQLSCSPANGKLVTGLCERSWSPWQVTGSTSTCSSHGWPRPLRT